MPEYPRLKIVRSTAVSLIFFLAALAVIVCIRELSAFSEPETPYDLRQRMIKLINSINAFEAKTGRFPLSYDEFRPLSGTTFDPIRNISIEYYLDGNQKPFLLAKYSFIQDRLLGFPRSRKVEVLAYWSRNSEGVKFFRRFVSLR